MKYCPNCGEKIEDNAKFCVNCGYEQIILTTYINEQNLTQKKKRKYSKDDILDAVGCLLIFVGIIFLIILYIFFKDLIAFLWPIVLSIILISCIIRLLGAGIIEVVQRSKDKKHNKK